MLIMGEGRQKGEKTEALLFYVDSLLGDLHNFSFVYQRMDIFTGMSQIRLSNLSQIM